MTLSHRQFVIKAVYPALAVIEIRQAFFSPDVVAVLRPGRIAANFRLVVNGFAESERAQEIKAMAGALLGLQLKCMISGVSCIRDRREGRKAAYAGAGFVAEWRLRRIKAGLGPGDLIQVAQHLKVSALRPNISWANQDLTRQLVFEIHVPLVVDRCLRMEILAGYAGKLRVIRIQKAC